MANKRILDFPSASALTGAELVPMWQSSITAQATLSAVSAAVNNWYVVNTVGDGSTDDTAVINAAIAATAGTNQPLYFKANPSQVITYIKITSGLVFTNVNQSIYMDGNTIFLWYGANSSVAVTVGDGTHTFNRNIYYINVHNSVAHGATGITGIKVLGAHVQDTFYLGSTYCAIGLQCRAATSTGNGIAYCKFFLQDFQQNTTCINIHEDTTGFCNQNMFFGGHLTPLGSPNYGVVFDRESGGYSQTQQNYFLGTSFEGFGNPIYFNDCGTQNVFEQLRDEGNGTYFVSIRDNGAYPNNNLIQLAYSDHSGAVPYVTITRDTGNLPGSGLRSAYHNIVTSYDYGVQEWRSGPLVEKAFVTGSATSGGPAGFLGNSVTVLGAIMGSTDAYSTSGKVWIGKNSLIMESTRLGWYIDCRYFQDFDIRADYPAGTNQPIVYAGFLDASGAWLNGTDGYPYSSGTATKGTNIFLTNDGYNVGNCKIRCPPNAVTMRIGVGGTGTPANISSMTIRAWPSVNFHDGSSHALYVYSGPLQIPGNFACAASPASYGNGYSPAGMIVGDSTGGSKGWYCTAAGYNARPWVASTAFYKDMLVQNDTGKTYVCVTAGTSAGSGGPTGTGAAIADNTAVWDYVSSSLATWGTM